MERGFRLSWKSVPVAAVQRMMAVLQDIYPNYSTKLYIVNLPSYLGWFVRFVKGFLCEMVQRKTRAKPFQRRCRSFLKRQLAKNN